MPYAVVQVVVVIGDLQRGFAPIFTIAVLLQLWRIFLINFDTVGEKLRQRDNLCRVCVTAFSFHFV